MVEFHQTKKDPNVLVFFSQNTSTSLTFDDLPVPMQDKIICHLSDARDIINLGQTTPTLLRLSENKMLWKKLCYFHFSNKKVN